jgi:hypothetical protein
MKTSFVMTIRGLPDVTGPPFEPGVRDTRILGATAPRPHSFERPDSQPVPTTAIPFRLKSKPITGQLKRALLGLPVKDSPQIALDVVNHDTPGRLDGVRAEVRHERVEQRLLFLGSHLLLVS